MSRRDSAIDAGLRCEVGPRIRCSTFRHNNRRYSCACSAFPVLAVIGLRPAWARRMPGAPAALFELLDPARGALQMPIRSEVFGHERFAQYGHHLALTQRATRAKWGSVDFFPRVQANVRVLRESQHFISAQAAAGHDISPAADWLLDNFHLIEAQLIETREGMPQSYFRALPVLKDDPLAGLPRIYGIAWAFISHTDADFDDELFIQFLNAYQQKRELRLGELWALPTTLRIILIENLRRLCERDATFQAAHELANLCCDHSNDVSATYLDNVFLSLTERGAADVFLTQMSHRLLDRGASPQGSIGFWLHQKISESTALHGDHDADQTADNVSVINAISSLRAIGNADWSEIVTRCSPLLKKLLGSPTFRAEHTVTRDQNLHRIEQLSQRSGRSELEVADLLLQLMEPDTKTIGATAGYWLHGAGRPVLIRKLGIAGLSFGPSFRRRAALSLYLTALALGTSAAVFWLLHQYGVTRTSWLALLGIVALSFPISEIVIAVVNRVVSESVRPRRLPRLALRGGLQPEHRVIVAVPAMLGSETEIDALVHRLHIHFLANPEQHSQFALLSDWLDATSARCDNDNVLLDCAIRGIAGLNTRYPVPIGVAPRFILLHRERQFSKTEQCWIGWERKRGKLEMLVRVLANGNLTDAFMDLGETSRVAEDVRYILTLDSDTILPPERLRDLISIAAHPLNRPQLDASQRTITAGLGILQPRIVTPLPVPERRTPYLWLFGAPFGVDAYSSASSDVYQDLFDEGSFSGKGLLDVQAMYAVLSRRLPEDRVLSHDLLEGALARCATVSDLSLIEDAPHQADIATSRRHRWTRGDWQLLPFLLNLRRWRLGVLNRWKLIDNLRRSLVPPMSLLVLLLALGGHVIAPWIALIVVTSASVAGPVLGALAGFIPHRSDLVWRHFFQHAVTEAARAAAGAGWHLSQLLSQSLHAIDAICRALYRLTISQRHLLQWAPYSSLSGASDNHWAIVLWRHRLTTALAVLSLIVLLTTDTPAPALTTGLCLLWAFSPLLVWWASRCRAPDQLPAREQQQLTGIARDTWNYFEHYVNAESQHLPPDNLQTHPYPIVAHRTSPTNIGLYLLAAACARRFGWINDAEFVRRLSATTTTLRSVERHRGHFFNWYDTKTLEPLHPLYVSTVDSGNLSGHLLAVAQACLELATTAADSSRDLARSLHSLAQTCQSLAWEPDYAFLYHQQRHLLYIGYRVTEQEFDPSFYDLLASESRLTSLLAIAKGDVPMRHWLALGRPVFAAGTRSALRSWSGSMFEYLMPRLILDEPREGLLHETCETAINEQIAFASRHGIPWGISESAYAVSDHTLAYQYAPQGVPRLALRRTPSDEIVVAPYATALAAQLAPRRACVNFASLEEQGVRTEYGFIEALDYSPARQSSDISFTPVNTFMAHHQGMTIVALANVLLDDVARRWGMADPHLEAFASLLHERPPNTVSALREPATPPPRTVRDESIRGLRRDVIPGRAAVEPTHLLSNGRYTVELRANGAGASRWHGIGITRWRDDILRDTSGSFFYLRRKPEHSPVSLTQRPAPDAMARYHAVFHPDQVHFNAIWRDLHAKITVWVSPEDDIEFRQIEITNTKKHHLEFELISAFEVTLADERADESHPAFSNLFVRAAWHATQQALVLERRPRLDSERHLYAAHFIAQNDEPIVDLKIQTDRQRWLGRNHTASQPQASFDPVPHPSEGPSVEIELDTGLDPVSALAVRLNIDAGKKVRLTFATAVSDDRGTLHAIIDKYHQTNHVQRASRMSATLAGIHLRSHRFRPEDYSAFQALTTALLNTLTRPQQALQRPIEITETYDRNLLMRHGISGDRPIIAVKITTMQGVSMLRTLIQGLKIWARSSVQCDMVVINAEPASYQVTLQRELAALLPNVGDGDIAHSNHTALHLLRIENVSDLELHTLRQLARLWLHADGRSLHHHVRSWCALHETALETRQRIKSTALPSSTAPWRIAPEGSVDPIDGTFSFDVGAGVRPLRPWVNILSNPEFGTQITESGACFTWAINSRLNQLTLWSNDPVADPSGESFLLQNARTREIWNIGPSAAGAPNVVYRIMHTPGRSVIRHHYSSLDIQAEWCVDPKHMVKQLRLTVTNQGRATQVLRALAIVEWMLGASRAERATIHTSANYQQLDGQRLTTLLATQQEHAFGFGNGTAFLATTSPMKANVDWSCDRRECFGYRGETIIPERFMKQAGSGLDPCAVLATDLTVGASQTIEVVYLMGYAGSPQDACQLAASAASVVASRRTDEALRRWDDVLSAITVNTPDSMFDAMVNRWLLYQTISCRMWAKAGFYQAGGATGYRDQLQDAMALSWSAPEMLSTQIRQCAARQFIEGDVQHWWHAPTGAGVRTHSSDDLLWLPYACLHYLRSSGDTALLDELVPFIQGPMIPESAEDAYFVPEISSTSATIYEHAARCIDRSLAVGAHGLPLMGGGDWNDGMNRVGHLGRGESVWLGWFLLTIVDDFVPLARSRGDMQRATAWEAAAQGWKTALHGPAWDGAWFRRAFFDNGQALGSYKNDEARIDLMAQVWAVLSGHASPQKELQAMTAVEEHLMDTDAGLIRLLDPPFMHAEPSPGYIQAYPPGVRENGGQYSHAAVWALMAQARLTTRRGTQKTDADLAYRSFTWLSPMHRTAHPVHGVNYGLEPYVMAGDIYSQPPWVGRGGWSWYTGAAAWMHRAAIESIFGLQVRAEDLAFEPCLPTSWPRAELTLRRDGRTLHFILQRESSDVALPTQTRTLRIGEKLRWRQVTAEATFVIRLPD